MSALGLIRSSLIIVASVVFVLIALFWSVESAKEFSSKLVHTGCVAALLGGAKSQSSCLDGMLATGSRLLYASIAWWALFGALLLSGHGTQPSQRIRLAQSLAKYAGGTTGALVVLLYLFPAITIFVVFFLLPFVGLLLVGVLALVRSLFGVPS